MSDNMTTNLLNISTGPIDINYDNNGNITHIFIGGIELSESAVDALRHEEAIVNMIELPDNFAEREQEDWEEERMRT